MDGMLISIIVFLIVYAAITFELVNKAVAAFCGVSILMLLHIITELGEVTLDQIPPIREQLLSA